MAMTRPAVRSQREQQPRVEAGTRLSIVSARRLRARAERRRARALVTLACLVVAATILIVAGAQTLLTSEQMRLDQLTQAQATATLKGQNLELERAQLSAPTRILHIAEQRLKMISPTSITYLQPVAVGPPLSSRRAN